MMGNVKTFIPEKFMKYDVVKHHHDIKVHTEIMEFLKVQLTTINEIPQIDIKK